MTATHTTRITDTVAWHPHDYNWAGYSSLDLVTEATQHLTRAILNLTTTEDNNAAQSQPINDITHKLADDMQALVQLYPVIKDVPVAFIVQECLDMRGDPRKAKKQLEFKIRWAGYGPEDDTWETWEHVRDNDAVHLFLYNHPSLRVRKLLPKSFVLSE